MRRIEHERGRAFAESVMDRCRYMTLAIANEAEAPYCVPLSPVRRGDCIYVHCALEGRKLALMGDHPVVSMSFVGETQVPPGAFTIYYESVLAEGTATEVTDREEKVEALRLLCEKYCPEDMARFEMVLDAWFSRTGIWRITLEKVTSKCNFPHAQ